MSELSSEPFIYTQMPTKAFAEIKGNDEMPGLRGIVHFTEVPYGTEVYIEIEGLPAYQPASGDENPIGPHGFHIHENGSCKTDDPDEPFQGAGGHWDPDDQPHGNHAGDFPVLFSNDGYTRMIFFTNRFFPRDIIDKSVIVHENPDDYRTQPAGDSGTRIGCGVIKAAK